MNKILIHNDGMSWEYAEGWTTIEVTDEQLEALEEGYVSPHDLTEV